MEGPGFNQKFRIKKTATAESGPKVPAAAAVLLEIVFFYNFLRVQT
jgi:hypothetical protein